MAVALVGWGLPIAFVGVVPAAALAPLAMAIVGTSNAVLDVSAFTLLQRTIPNRDRAAVFTVLEAIVGLGLSLGGVLAPLLIALFGIRGALIVSGAILPVATALTWRTIRRADDLSVVPEHDLRLLRGIPMFGLLPMTIIERLAGSLTRVDVAPGEVIIREGEPGDRYLIVATGSLEVSSAGKVLGMAGPGDGIGEIALLRRVPRTATVTAVGQSRIYALDSGAFLGAISEHLGNTSAADVVVAERLLRSEEARSG
jgi:MFS family permease